MLRSPDCLLAVNRVNIGNDYLVSEATRWDGFVQYPARALKHADVEGVAHHLAIRIGYCCAGSHGLQQLRTVSVLVTPMLW